MLEVLSHYPYIFLRTAQINFGQALGFIHFVNQFSTLCFFNYVFVF